MKTHLSKFLVLSFAFLVFSVGAFAQSNPLTVEIPFNFHVGNEKLAAGKYLVKRISANAFLLQNENGNAKVLAQTPVTVGDAKDAVTEQLIFNRYENKYFLRQIFAARSTVGRGLYESKSEKNIRQGRGDELEAKKVKPTQVALQLKTN